MCVELKDAHLSELLLWVIKLRRRFRITGNSMLPMLKPGDEVLVNPRAYRSLLPHAGDIVVAQHPYRTDLCLVKRVVEVFSDGRCFIKGDNPSESTDSCSFGAVTPERILGRVTSRFP
jgi:nickel-type superoxide dismutase maturation protease